ncbi:MAG: hypothetical protein Q8N60_01375 [Candidatus Diapherotrites archaeon]|nr:hypothetical protein [Candidatus Diapherotrites archaeon]
MAKKPNNKKRASKLKRQMAFLELQRKLTVLNSAHVIEGNKMKIRFDVREHNIIIRGKLSEIVGPKVDALRETNLLKKELIDDRKKNPKPITKADLADMGKLRNLLGLWRLYYTKFVKSYKKFGEIDKRFYDEMRKLGNVEIPSWFEENRKKELADLKKATATLIQIRSDIEYLDGVISEFN